MSATSKITPEKTSLVKLVARGNIYNIRFIAEAFGYSNPYDGDECEHVVTEKLKEPLVADIIVATDADIEFILTYLRDEAYIDI
ncbi:hypothetical protein H8E06_01260 [bacterium]|nr:hypothetical protein [bacterium]